MSQYPQQVIDAYRAIFGRHLVSFMWFEQPCNYGHPIGDWKHTSLSGFVMSLGDQRVLLTAGHAPADLDKRLVTKEATIWGTSLCGSMGFKPTSEAPIPFAYEKQSRWVIQNRARGVDVAAIRLEPEVWSRMAANGVEALSIERILSFSESTFDEYAAMGIPMTTYEKDEYEIDGEIAHEGRSQLVLMPVTLAEPPSDILPTEHPRIFFRPKTELSTEQVNGMSGAPIFGLQIRENGTLKGYRVVAMQFGHRDDGLCVASPSEVFAGIVRDWLTTG